MNNDLDLVEIVAKIKIFLLNNTKKIVFFTSIGLLVGLLAYSFKMNDVKTGASFTINTEYLYENVNLTKEIFNTLTEEKGFIILPSNLGQSLLFLDKDSISKLELIFSKLTMLKIEMQFNHVHKVYVEYTDLNIEVNDIQSAIVSYLCNNKYVIENIMLEKELLESKIIKINEEMLEVDSAQKLILTLLTNINDQNNNNLFYDNIFGKSINLYNDKIMTEKRYFSLGKVNVVSGINIISRDKFSTKNIIIITFLGFVLGILYSLIIALNNLITEKIKSFKK
jgi:hypothetical protein